MRTTAMCLVLGAVVSAGCLRSTQFKCAQDTDCGASGVCEAVGYCSFPSSSCPGSGRSFGDSAGQGLAGTCVSGNNPPGVDAGVTIDAPVSIDAPAAGCPSPYAAVNGSAHLYKRVTNTSWDAAASACKLTSATAYLAVPDDATELTNLATVAAATPFWVGLDDQDRNDVFTIEKGGATATFLPWLTNPPDRGPPAKDCVMAISATQIDTDRCGNGHIAVCECEP
jgi:hypothetical protein